MPDQIHSFVDEAGDPTLFGRKRGSGVIIGNDGVSKFFIMGKLEVAYPDKLSNRLDALRKELMADPYFSGVPSFQPENKKTAREFHAKNDLPEVRHQVFQLLREFGNELRFHAVVLDKTVLAKKEIARRDHDPKVRYDDNTIYDGLISELYGKFHRMADEYHICIARRGKGDRTAALKHAVERAESSFEQKFGFSRGADWHITVSDPVQTACLQAVDYFLWSLQRLYERKEERFLNMMWPQIGEIHDLDHGAQSGTFFKGEDCPGLNLIFPRSHEPKRKTPRI